MLERASTSDDDRLQLSVRDTGIGIPPERADRLFKSFTQVDASTTRRYGGTGLGLAISKRLAELMGGTMWVESTGVPGEGSVFRFTIEAARDPRATARPCPSGRRTSLRGKALLVGPAPRDRRARWSRRSRATGGSRCARRGRPDEVRAHAARGGAPRRRGRRRRSGGDGPGSTPRLHERIAAHALLDGIRRCGGGGRLTRPLKPARRCTRRCSPRCDRPRTDRAAAAAHRAPTLDPGMGERLPLRILLAEDNSVNQMLAVRLLARPRLHGGRGRQRGRGGGRGRAPSHYDLVLDGRPDARDGRPRGHPRDPAPGTATAARASSP